MSDRAKQTPATISIYELPPAAKADPEFRWTYASKALVVKAVEEGILSLPQAYKRYELSIEEFLDWRQHKGKQSSVNAVRKRQLPRLRKRKPR